MVETLSTLHLLQLMPHHQRILSCQIDDVPFKNAAVLTLQITENAAKIEGACNNNNNSFQCFPLAADARPSKNTPMLT